MFFKPKYKIVPIKHGIVLYYRIHKLIFNWFYIPWGDRIYSQKRANEMLARCLGISVCMMCHTPMMKDNFGEFCPNEECIYVDVPRRTHLK